MSLQIIDMRTPDGPGQLRSLYQRLHLIRFRDETDQTRLVLEIIKDVAGNRDTAVIKYTKMFDKLELTSKTLRVSDRELKAARKNADPRFMEAMRRAIENVRSYQKKLTIPQSSVWQDQGIQLGILWEAIERVGVYAPGGKAVYPSSVVMAVVPAQVAGVKEIAVCCSPGLAGKVDTNMLAICAELGISEVYQIGGAQAIAAMAFGTETIKSVGKIVGPGNLYVQLAKKALYGQIDIDSFAGPSEVLIIADETAPADYIAADLLAQAEHDPGIAFLVTSSKKLADEVVEAVEKELQTAGRAEAIGESLEKFSAVLWVADMDEAIKEANAFAPEHLQVMVADPEKVVGQIKNAGAIFVGKYSPVALGDYYAGPSHVLPTAGTARAFSGLSVYDFLKRTSLISYDEGALGKAAADVQVLAKVEGLDMHGRSVSVRLEKKQQ
ncbi:MAG: histidinol dehydrogenase [Phycisphaerae bacterium]|nr:histidinol dehydrogenase [Phycisphaerae bacterium]